MYFPFIPPLVRRAQRSVKLTDLISPHVSTAGDLAALSTLYPLASESRPHSLAAAASGGRHAMGSSVFADQVGYQGGLPPGYRGGLPCLPGEPYSFRTGIRPAPFIRQVQHPRSRQLANQDGCTYGLRITH